MILDHLVHGAPTLEGAIDDLQARLGVRATGGGKHDGRGTHNALLGLGDGAYLELIAPDPDQAPPSLPRPFGLDELVAPGLVGWAVRVTDIDAAVERARARGHDLGDPIEMQRTRPDGVVLRWRLTLNAVGGGLIPFLIDWGDTEHPSTGAPAGLTLAELHVEHPGPAAVAPALAALDLDIDVIAAAAPALVATVDGPAGRLVLR